MIVAVFELSMEPIMFELPADSIAFWFLVNDSLFELSVDMLSVDSLCISIMVDELLLLRTLRSDWRNVMDLLRNPISSAIM